MDCMFMVSGRILTQVTSLSRLLVRRAPTNLATPGSQVGLSYYCALLTYAGGVGAKPTLSGASFRIRIQSGHNWPNILRAY